MNANFLFVCYRSTSSPAEYREMLIEVCMAEDPDKLIPSIFSLLPQISPAVGSEDVHGSEAQTVGPCGRMIPERRNFVHRGQSVFRGASASMHQSSRSQISDGFQLQGQQANGWQPGGHPLNEEALHMPQSKNLRNCDVSSQLSQTSVLQIPSINTRYNLSFSEQRNNRDIECELESVLHDASSLSKETISSRSIGELPVTDIWPGSVNSCASSESSRKDTSDEAETGTQNVGPEAIGEHAARPGQGVLKEGIDGMEDYFRQACGTTHAQELDKQTEPSVKRRRKTHPHTHRRSQFVNRRETKYNLRSERQQEAFPELDHQEP